MADVVEQAGEDAPLHLWSGSHQGDDASLNSDEEKGICVIHSFLEFTGSRISSPAVFLKSSLFIWKYSR